MKVLTGREHKDERSKREILRAPPELDTNIRKRTIIVREAMQPKAVCNAGRVEGQDHGQDLGSSRCRWRRKWPSKREARRGNSDGADDKADDDHDVGEDEGEDEGGDSDERFEMIDERWKMTDAR